jgi:uncharacterized protein (DUF433 family)
LLRLLAMEQSMVSQQRPVAVVAQVVSDPSVMSGKPVVRGTRIPADTVLAYLRAGHSPLEIFEDYPTLPVDGIVAVIAWAEATYGPDWNLKSDAPGQEVER